MPITKFPNGLSSFGGIVGPSHYAGWWGKKAFFVDDDDGLDGRTGLEPEKAFKTIQKAVDSAGPLDTIFLKPRELGGQVYPGYSAHGYYSGSIIIPNDRQGLAIIGTGRGGRGIGSNIQCMIEPDIGGSDVCLHVKSPGVSIENLGMKALTNSKGAIFADLLADSTEQAYGLTVSNCFFKDFKATGSVYGTINLVSIHWVTIQHCIFRQAGMGIHMSSARAKINDPVIRDCSFTGVASDWSADIRINDVKGLEISDCRFQHNPPSGGTNGGYIFCAGTVASGLISGCTFSYQGKTESNVMTITGTLEQAGNWGDDGLIS